MNHRTSTLSSKHRLQTPSLTSGSARSSSSMLSSTHDSGVGGSTTVGRSSPPLIDLELDNGEPRTPLALDAGAGVTAGDKLRALLRQMDAEVRASRPADLPTRPLSETKEDDSESSGNHSPPSPPPRITNAYLYNRRASDKSRSDGEDDQSPPRRLPSRVVALNAAAAAAEKAELNESLSHSSQSHSALHRFISSQPGPSGKLSDATPRPRVSSHRKGKEPATEYEASSNWSMSRHRRGSTPLDSRTPSVARPRLGKTPRRTSIDIPPDSSASFAAGLQLAPEVEPDLDEDSVAPWGDDDESIDSSEVSVPIDLQRGSTARFMAAEDDSFHRSLESLAGASFATANEGPTPRPRQRIPTDTSLPSLPDPDSTDDDEDDSPALRQRAEMFRPSPRSTPESRLDISSRPSSRDPTVYTDVPSFSSRSWMARSRTVRDTEQDDQEYREPEKHSTSAESVRKPLASSHSGMDHQPHQSMSQSQEVETTPRRRRRPNETSSPSEMSFHSQSPKTHARSPNSSRNSVGDTSPKSLRTSREPSRSWESAGNTSAAQPEDDKQPSLRESIRAGALTKSLAPVLRDTSDFRDSQLDLWMGAPQLASLTDEDIDMASLSWQENSVDRSLERQANETPAGALAPGSTSTLGGSSSRARAGSETPQAAVPSTPAFSLSVRRTHLTVEQTPLRSALKKVSSTPRVFLNSPGIRWSPEVLVNHPDDSVELPAEPPAESLTPPSTPPSHVKAASTSPTSSPPRAVQTPGMPTPRPPGAWQSPAPQMPSTPPPPQPQISGLQPTQTPGITPRPPGAWGSPLGRPFNTTPARTSGLRNEWRLDESADSTTGASSPKAVSSPTVARISTDSVHRIRLSPNPKRLQLSAKKPSVPATPPRAPQLGSQPPALSTPPRQSAQSVPETPPPTSPFSIDGLDLDPDSSWTAKLKRVVLSPMKPAAATTASLTEAQEALDTATRASAAARLRVASAQKAWIAALAAPEPVVQSARWTFWMGWVVLEMLLLWGVFRVTIDYATSNSYRAVYDPYARQYAVGIQLPSAMSVFAARRRTPANLFDLLDSLGIAVARGIWRPPT